MLIISITSHKSHKLLHFYKVNYSFSLGILKKTGTALESVPEFAESQLERTDSSLDVVENEVNTVKTVQQLHSGICECLNNY